MIKTYLTLLLCCVCGLSHAQQTPMDSLSTAEMEAYIRNAVLEVQAKKKYVKVEKKYRYRVTLTDKKNCGYSVKHPEKFLSAKALARRNRYGLKVDGYDLPVSAVYTRQLCAL